MISYKNELLKLYEVLKPIIWKAIPLVLVFTFGFHLGAGSEAVRIIDDCKFAKSFRVWSTAFNCNRII
jgi:hypothetical protein